jgi:hypothetical protein
MASIRSAVVAIALAASDHSPLEKIERRAAILTGVGVAFAVGGGVAIGFGVAAHEQRFWVGGTALIGVGLHLLALAVIAFLWPDDTWLGLLTSQSPSAVSTWGPSGADLWPGTR